MPITRLDMISMAPKTQEAGVHKQNEIQHQNTTQQNAVSTVQSQARANETQTVKSEKTENKEQKYDARDGKGGSYQGSSKGRKEEEEKKKEEQKKVMRGSTFDITV